MSIATLKDLDINPEQKLTPMVKQQLQNVIKEEFERQCTIFDTTADDRKEKILEEYKKSVGFDLLQKQYNKINDEYEKLNRKKEEITKKLHLKGLDSDGSKHQQHYYGNGTRDQREIKRACDKIDKLFATVDAQGPNNMKNKILSRLWLADTAGEATVILREVLGNGVIPTLTTQQLEYKEV